MKAVVKYDMAQAELVEKIAHEHINGSLPSGYWEPQPDKEDEERMEREIREGLREPVWPDEPLPFE